MITYRSYAAYQDKFGRERVPGGQGKEGKFEVEGYLHHQGAKFLKRFDAASYIAITRMMDTHDIARGRGSIEETLASITQPMLIAGVDSDVLYPISEQLFLHKHAREAEFLAIRSDAGHDGFLLEQAQLSAALAPFLHKVAARHASKL